MKTTMTVAEVNKQIDSMQIKVNALNAGINRMDGDRDFITEKRVLKEMKEGYQKKLDILRSSIADVRVEIDL